MSKNGNCLKVTFAILIVSCTGSHSALAVTSTDLKTMSEKGRPDNHNVPTDELKAACQKVSEKDRRECMEFMKDIMDAQDQDQKIDDKHLLRDDATEVRKK